MTLLDTDSTTPKSPVNVVFKVRIKNTFVDPPTNHVRKFSLLNPTFQEIVQIIKQDPLLERVLSDPSIALTLTYTDADGDSVQLVSDDDLTILLSETSQCILELSFVRHQLPLVPPPPYTISDSINNNNNNNNSKPTQSTNPLSKKIICNGCQSALPRSVDGYYYESLNSDIHLCGRCYPHKEILNYKNLTFNQVI